MTRLSFACIFLLLPFFVNIGCEAFAAGQINDLKQVQADTEIRLNFSTKSKAFIGENGVLLKNSDSALFYLKKAYKAGQYNSVVFKRKILLSMSQIYLSPEFLQRHKVVDMDEIFYLNKFLLLGPAKLSPLLMSKAHFVLFKADSSASRLTEAFKHYQQYRAVTDSLFNAGTGNRLRNIYNATKNNQIRRTLKPEIHNRTANSNGLVYLTILFIITSIILVIAYKRKKANQHRLDDIQRQLDEKGRSLIKLNIDTKKKIAEKESLITEMHHNVKNNLQIIISLLNSQSAYLKNETAVSAINESQSRLHIMSLIYKKLYGSTDVELIEMEVYVDELICFLTESLHTDSRKIRFITNVESLHLEIGMATQVGLFLNEAITNALKYAFLKQDKGEVMVSINRCVDKIAVRVADNGSGFPVQLKSFRKDAIGIDLMKSICAQLEGLFSIQNKNGLTVMIVFPALAKHIAAGVSI